MMTNKNDQNNNPLYVDLDGTLIKTDLIIETFFALLRINLLYAFMVPFWLLKGKAHLKQMIADRVDIDVSLLPYNETFLDYIKQEAGHGRSLVLATASNKKYAIQIHNHLGIFDHVIASDSETNMSGENKLNAIMAHCNNSGFEYAGNAAPDLKIWKQSSGAIIVNPERAVERMARRQGEVVSVFQESTAGIKSYLKAIRIHQWLKNLLMFIPLVMAHKLFLPELIVMNFAAFISFSFCASSVYLLNDFLDLPDDRSHPRKRERPLASGTIKTLNGALLIPVLLIASIVIALFLPFNFLIVLLAYYLLTLAYSLYLKRIVLVDVILLAILYTIRVIAGAAATGIIPSFWLLAFSMFLFLSLAFIKRSAELTLLKSQNKEISKSRGYKTQDLEYLHSMGTSSAYLSVLVIAFYINTREVVNLYTHPQFLWLMCPILLYWVSRMWLKAGRGEMHDDPLVFAVTDRASQVSGIMIISVLLVALLN